jgi:competence protein ComEA
MRRFLWALAFTLVSALLLEGWLRLISSPPVGEPIKLLPPATRAPILVQVSGAVARPGVYPLAYGSRAADAIAAAGGFTTAAQTEAVNGAAHLQDGEQLTVPSQPVKAAPAAGQAAAAVAPHRPIDLNRATQADLESLPRIGPAIAARILAYRQEHGPFQRVSDLLEVNGIGPAVLAEIKDLLVIAAP